MNKKTIAVVLSFLILCLGYGYFGTYLERSNFLQLITLYSTLFLFTFQLLKNVKNYTTLIVFGIVFRLLFLIVTPNLSQDFYRFIWDGHTILNGASPYLFTPEQFINNLPPKELLSQWSASQWESIIIPNAEGLHEGMGSLNGSHYSNYPPLNQIFFTLASWLGGNSILESIIVFRLIMIVADIGILYYGKKLLTALQLPIKNIFWYFLNPFIIIELTGNLHFEGVMLFFVVAGLFYLHHQKWILGAVLLGCSISLKLLPLLFLPLFFQWFVKNNTTTSKGVTKLIGFYILTITTFVLSFVPFASGAFVDHFLDSVGLWFQKFEFNASIYYVIRWIGYQVVGWNLIATIGKILPIVVLLSVLGLTFFRKNKSTLQLITALLWASSIYFLLATTVHPWYIATPLLLSVFTRYRFPILWSFLVFLSYSAYGAEGFQENFWLITVEYVLVVGVAIGEIFYKDSSKSLKID